jgi:hypothetical protein
MPSTLQVIQPIDPACVFVIIGMRCKSRQPDSEYCKSLSQEVLTEGRISSCMAEKPCSIRHPVLPPRRKKGSPSGIMSLMGVFSD